MIEMNVLTKEKQTHRHRKQTYGYQRGKVGYYIKCINNKDLPCSTGNPTHYLVKWLSTVLILGIVDSGR